MTVNHLWLLVAKAMLLAGFCMFAEIMFPGKAPTAMLIAFTCTTLAVLAAWTITIFKSQQRRILELETEIKRLGAEIGPGK